MSSDDKTRLISEQSQKVSSRSDKTVIVGIDIPYTGHDATIAIGSTETSNTGGQPILTMDDTKIINNRFELLSVLGSGGMGVVFKARDRRKVEAKDSDPFVAIKLLNDDFKVHPDSVVSLQREARRSQKLAHPNIVNVHDFDRDGDQVYMTMECLKGEPLDELIKKNGNKLLEIEVAHSIVKDMTSAMIHAHKNNIAHSDFKPGNIFVTNSGQGKVLDFGIARAVSSGLGDEKLESGDNTLFDPSSLGALTPAYASLEMLEGELPDICDDVYAIGCVAYQLFTGKHPFSKKSAVDAQKEKMRPARIKALSGRQWRALRKALAFKRDDRYTSAEHFWEDFNGRYSPVWLVAGFILLVAGGGAYWSEMERERIEAVDEEAIRLQADQDNAYGNLQSWIAREPISRHEEDVRNAYNAYKSLVGENTQELLDSKKLIVDLYVKEAETLRLDKQLNLAKARLLSATEWDAAVNEREDYQAVNRTINQDIETEKQRVLAEQLEKERQKTLALELKQQAERKRRSIEQQAQAAEAAADREASYQKSEAVINGMLNCQQYPDFESFRLNVNNMRAIDVNRYQKQAPDFSERLAICVKRIGGSNPTAGKAAKDSALAIFPDSKVVKGIVIDPCASTKLSPGSGRRASKYCYDAVNGAVNGPKMVVIPGIKGGKPYAIGKYEITAKEFDIYCSVAGNDCDGISDLSSDLPVTGLSIDQAKAYAKWLSNKTGFEYRIPSYAEWLNAAVATGRKKNLDPNCTVTRVNGTRAGESLRVAGGSFNDWGLYNVVGNAQEWAIDGATLVAAGGQHTDRLADNACSIQAKVTHKGAGNATTGFRLIRVIKR